MPVLPCVRCAVSEAPDSLWTYFNTAAQHRLLMSSREHEPGTSYLMTIVASEKKLGQAVGQGSAL